MQYDHRKRVASRSGDGAGEDRRIGMKAQVMISSVVQDKIRLGAISRLGSFWFDAAGLLHRLTTEGHGTTANSEVPFSFVRSELRRHLEGKYNFDAYIFEETPGAGRAPAEETRRMAQDSHLFIGIFGSSTGWKVSDHDALTPTFREWRAALQTPLKCKLFWLKGSPFKASDIGGELGKTLQELADYKKGTIYLQFGDVLDLFTKIDRVVQDYIQRSIVRYVSDTVAREPTAEEEEWLLSPYRIRHEKMTAALQRVGASLGVKNGIATVGGYKQPVALHSVPDSFSIPESRKFAAYIFDDEAQERNAGELGELHFVAGFQGITEGQVRRHVGNFEAAEIYRASWGLYAAEPSSGVQCVYLPRCVNSLVMHESMSSALDWLNSRANKVQQLATHRKEILDLMGRAGARSGRKPAKSARAVG